MPSTFERQPVLLIVGVVLLGLGTVGAYLEPAQIAKGQQVYADRKCSGCHTIEGQGGKEGPDLSRVGRKR